MAVVCLAEDNKVYLLHADRLYYDQDVNMDAQILVGNVRFRHENALMFCDSAMYYEATNSFDAFGNVRMVQGDTLSLKSDVLFYNGLDKMARARYNVVLKHRGMTVYTDSLDYDRLYEMGYFFEGGHLVDKDNDLTSDWGEYNPKTREVTFNYNVRMVSPPPPKRAQTVLLTDTLHYYTQRGVGFATGPSTIDNGGSHIYTESGYMNSRTNDMILLNRSELNENGKKLIGDSIVWNSKDSVGEAFGNVYYDDILNKNRLKGEHCYYDDKIGYSMGTDSTCVIDYSQGKDTLYMHADSIKMFTHYMRTDSVFRTMHAYHKVRMYRDDMQGVCDSLVYNTKDSTIILYRDPIIWVGKQQLLGEEIRAFLNDSTVDSVQVLRQTLSCERLDSLHYNQVAGHEIHAYLRDGDVEMTHVIGNVLVNFFPLDSDSMMIGMNHTESTEMKMYFTDERRIDHIWMPASTGTMYPIFKIPEKERFLSNFFWFSNIRPKDKDDIYSWEGKCKEAELKPEKHREAPLQKLKDIKNNH